MVEMVSLCNLSFGVEFGDDCHPGGERKWQSFCCMQLFRLEVKMCAESRNVGIDVKYSATCAVCPQIFLLNYRPKRSKSQYRVDMRYDSNARLPICTNTASYVKTAAPVSRLFLPFYSDLQSCGLYAAFIRTENSICPTPSRTPKKVVVNAGICNLKCKVSGIRRTQLHQTM
jgi:hypothetical protein